MTQDPILRDVVLKRQQLDGQFAPLAQSHLVARRLIDAADSLEQRLAGPTDWLALRDQLVFIQAICYRATRDLGLETVADAAGKDIPF